MYISIQIIVNIISYLIFAILGNIIGGLPIFIYILIGIIFFLNIKSLKDNFVYIKNHLLTNKLNTFIFILLSLYFEFSLFGSRLFTTVSFNITYLFYLTLLFIPITILLMYIINIILKMDFTKPSKKYNLNVFTISFCIVFVISFLYLITYYPAISSPDTLDQFMQALELKPIFNWHTPFHTLIIRLCLSVFNHPSTVVILQIILFSYVIAFASKTLKDIGINEKTCMVFSLIFILIPSNAILINTLWKDVMYAACLLWLTVLITRYIFNLESKSILFYIQLSFSLSSIYLLRQNGIVPYILSVIVLVVIAKFNKKIIITVLSSIVFILIIIFPVYNFFNVQKEESYVGGAYIGLGQDIIGAKEYGGTLGEDAQYIYDELTNVEDYKYYPSYAKSSYSLDMKMSDFIFAYIDTFIKNPFTMTCAMLNRVDLMWGIPEGRDAIIGSVYYTGTMDENETWQQIAPERIDIDFFLFNIIRQFVLISKQPFLKLLFWRVGIFLFVSLITIFILITKKQYKYICTFTPMIGQILALLLSTGWADYRYFYSISLISMFLILALNKIFEKNQKKSNITRK